ncbi:MAG: nucleoside triphosphate pyrophosphohydrolase [Acidobacteria bacterium]|nr:nucleoside triphosphate pyrophosphohydrolase [Acidobacteriota bacterium]
MGSPKKSVNGSVKTKAKSAPARAVSAKKSVAKSAKSPAAATTAPKQVSAGDWFEKLVAIQKRLRDPGGCPWDIEQNHQTLRTYLIEEAYEVLDAIDSGEDEKFVEELGDLLLQVTFHSQIASEANRFNISDVVQSIHDKMIRRHPHVFGGVETKNSEDVLRNWQKIKTQERAEKEGAAGEPKRESALDGVPKSIPATLEGLQLTKKAARTGFDWASAAGVFAKVREETTELEHTLEHGTALEAEEELGDLLFAVVNLARFLHVDPEIALKRANGKFVRRFHEMERLAATRGRKFEDVPRPEKETLWNSAKELKAAQAAAAAPVSSLAGVRKASPHR